MTVGGFARAKGQRGERAVVKLLQPIINSVYAEFELEGDQVPDLQRNQMQSHKGGYDIVGLDWLALEVKHQETLNLNSWWLQATTQAKDSKIPVLIYKQNRVKWRVVMYGYLPVGGDWIDWPRTPVDITLEAFLVYFRLMVANELRVEKS